MARFNVRNAHINTTRTGYMERISVPKKASQRSDWHPADIVAALRKAGWTVRALAIHYDIAPTGLSRAMRESSPAGERRIAKALNLHPKTIWPSRYHADGSRKLQGIHAIQSTRDLRGRNGNTAAQV